MTCIASSKQDHKERTPCIFRKLGEIQSNRGGNLDTAPAGVFVVPPPVAAGPHAAMAAPPQGRNGALRRRRRPGPCCPGKQMGRGHTGAQTHAPRSAPARPPAPAGLVRVTAPKPLTENGQARTRRRRDGCPAFWKRKRCPKVGAPPFLRRSCSRAHATIQNTGGVVLGRPKPKPASAGPAINFVIISNI